MRLLYFVDDYPYGTTEFFPHLECKYLAEVFEEIVVIPRQPFRKGSQPAFPIPKGVTVCGEVAESLQSDLDKRGTIRKQVWSRRLPILAKEIVKSPVRKW